MRIFLAALIVTIAYPLRWVSAAQINTYGKLEIISDDRTFSMRFRGRVFIDGNFYKSDSDDKQLTSGTFIRSARIGVEGNFHEWDYAIEYDNATDVPSLKDAVMRRTFGPGKAAIGQFKVSESMEQMATANDTAFMERPYVSEITPGYKIGLGYNGEWKALGFSGNVYNKREASEAEAKPTNDGMGLAARGYFSPVNQKTLAVHLGSSYARERTDVTGGRERVSPIGRAEEYRNEEDFRFTLYDRQDERADIDRFILEAAHINGPLCVQAEYLAGRAHTKTRADDTFNTWYAQVSYVLTGEFREYLFRKGAIRSPEPSRSSGAVEIAARYQQAEREKVRNAELTATEFSVIYYANTNVRYLANYGWAANKLINDRPQLFAVRAQFDF